MTPRLFAWQAWHLVTSTFISRGRRGTNSHPPRIVLRGRRGTYGIGWRAWSGFVARDAAAVCVAGVVLGDIHLHFTWQAWHKLTSTFVLRGRRGTHGTGWRAWSGFVACDAAATLRGRRGLVTRGRRPPPSFCVAGVALMVLGGALGPDLSPVTPRPLCVAGVALGDIHLHFTWQAWHKLTSTVVLRGRRGTYGMVGGALGPDLSPVTPRLFAWQAWHLVTSTFVSRGRRGTNSHPPSFCVAGVALMGLGGALGPDLSPVTPRLFAWQAWYLVTSTFISRGRRGTNLHPPSFCVAGVALMGLGGALGPDLSPVTPRLFAWQAWYLVTSTFISRGRRGTNSHPPSFCVAGVAPSLTHPLSHTIFFTTPSFTHHFVTHHLSPHPLPHTTLSPHYFSHTTLSHTIFDTPSFTHHLVTHHL